MGSNQSKRAGCEQSVSLIPCACNILFPIGQKGPLTEICSDIYTVFLYNAVNEDPAPLHRANVIDTTPAAGGQRL